jgi:MFS family permease
VPHRRRFLVLCVGIWLHAADSLVTATIAPAIVDDIGGIAFINWTIMLYEVGAIVAAAAAPMLCQRLGVKRVLGFAALVYGGGCLIAGFAPNVGVLLAGRLAQGIGGGMLLSLCYLAIQEWFDQARWSRLFGIVALIWGAGSLLGPLIGGAFAGLHAWRMAFFVFAAQAGALWVLASLWLLALSAATTGFWAYGPLILKILFGTQPLICGYILAGEAVAWSLATLAVSKVPVSADRWLIRAGATMIALGAGGFAIAVPAGVLAGMVLCALLQGLGFGLCWPSIVHRIARLSDDGDRPLAVTSPETMQRIGYAVGTAAVGIAANLAGLAEGVSIAAAKSAAFWVFAAFVPVLIVALICAWTFTARHDITPLAMTSAARE